MDNIKNNHYDFVIIGAGVIGSLYALNLKKRGFKIFVIDPSINNTLQSDEFSILVALNILSVEQINQIDSQILDLDLDFTKMCIWAGDYWNKKMTLSCEDNDQQNLGKMKKLNELKYQLNQKIKRQNIDYSEQNITQIDKEKKQIELENNEKISFDFCLLADGRQTKWLKELNFEIQEQYYFQKSMIVEVELQHPHNQTNLQVFNKDYILAILTDKQFNTAQLIIHCKRDHILALSQKCDDTFKKMVNDSLFSSDIQIKNYLSELKSVNIDGKQINYQSSNFPIICVGDSYLSIHPLAGQGLNFGIKAQELFFQLLDSKKISWASTQRLDYQFIELWLKQFEKSILPMKYLVHSIAKGYTHYIPDEWTAFSFNLLNKIPFFKKWVVEYASKLKSI